MAERTQVIVARIETLAVDAIVNPANARLEPGGGADGAIRAAAGPEMNRLLASAGGLAEGAALTTPGFRLPARWVIHTVAPIWDAPGEENEKVATLRACYGACLSAGAEVGVKTIAFPAIGTGVYRWPKQLACETAVGVVRAHPAPIGTVTFCCYSEEDAAIYRAALG
jgi:O-acetyl-ADP-ribose deacetylase (regulator of RNase III)